MITDRWKRKKILTASKTIKLAEQLSKCPDVTRFNEGRWKEEWALAYCFDGTEDSARAFLNQHLPNILRSNIGDEELFELLLVEICEEFRHTLYHIREPRFYRYLHEESTAGLSQARPRQMGSAGEEHGIKVRLLREARNRQALTTRLAQLPKVNQYDSNDWKEANAIVQTFAGIEAAFRSLLDNQFPRLTKPGLRTDETYDLLREVGKVFGGLVDNVKASRFYWYLLEPLDQEWTGKAETAS